jgi:hypothetical protein
LLELSRAGLLKTHDGRRQERSNKTHLSTQQQQQQQKDH